MLKAIIVPIQQNDSFFREIPFPKGIKKISVDTRLTKTKNGEN